MRPSTTVRVILTALATLALAAGCTSDATNQAGPTPVGTPAPSTSSPAPPPTPYVPVPGSCPVTVPGPVPSSEPWAPRLFGSASAFGNDELWVGGLGEGGVLIAGPGQMDEDGSIGWKFGWWRITPGTLTITGQRLDATAPPAEGAASDGYGDRGFQSSGVVFPTQGCWEVTGRVGTASLTFVTVITIQAP